MKLIQATDKFRSVIFITTASIAGIYLIDLIGRWLLHMSVPLINSTSPAGIAISVVIVAVAALNLILDFDFIEKGEADSEIFKQYEEQEKLSKEELVGFEKEYPNVLNDGNLEEILEKRLKKNPHFL